MDPNNNNNPEEPKVDPAANPEDPEVNKDPKEGQEPSQEPEQEPKKPEPEKKFSKRERLMHARDKIEQQLDDLEDEEDENRPLTVGEFKRMQQENSRQSAVDLAESSIEDEDERSQVVEILKTRITPSGDPEQDLELARGAVNSIKNAQIAEETARNRQPNNHGSSPGGPGSGPEEVFEPTADEQVFMRPPYNLSKDDIIKARRKTQGAAG